MCAASYIGRQIHIVGEFAIQPVNRLLAAALNENGWIESHYFTIFDQGGLMKKFLIIIVLTLLQCACATQDPAPYSGSSLLSFDAIGAEITVSYEQAEAAADLSQSVALNIDN
jgi:hypothetical protein